MAPTSAPTLAPTTRSGRMPSASSACSAPTWAKAAQTAAGQHQGQPRTGGSLRRPGTVPRRAAGRGRLLGACRQDSGRERRRQHARAAVRRTCPRVDGGGYTRCSRAIDPGKPTVHAAIAVPQRQAGRPRRSARRPVGAEPSSRGCRNSNADRRRRGRLVDLAVRHHARPSSHSACSDSTIKGPGRARVAARSPSRPSRLANQVAHAQRQRPVDGHREHRALDQVLRVPAAMRGLHGTAWARSAATSFGRIGHRRHQVVDDEAQRRLAAAIDSGPATCQWVWLIRILRLD